MNMKKIIIFGAGRGGRDVLQLIEQINMQSLTWSVLGFIDKNPLLIGSMVDGIRVYNSLSGISEDFEGTYAITGIQSPDLRKKIIEVEIENNGLKLARLIHPSINVSEDCVIAEGCVIFPGVFIAKNVSLGKSVLVNYNSLLGIDLVIGDFSFVGPSVTITASCSIGNSSTIGAGCLFVPGVKVGNNCMIGLGTKLIDSVEDSQNVFDFPRKITRDMDGREKKVSW